MTQPAVPPDYQRFMLALDTLEQHLKVRVHSPPAIMTSTSLIASFSSVCIPILWLKLTLLKVTVMEMEEKWLTLCGIT